MICPTCGAEESSVLVINAPEGAHHLERIRQCVHGHYFQTFEVNPAQLADRREMSCAVRRIERRIAQHQRDLLIARDPRPVKEVAAEYKITRQRVHQIRASFRSLPADRDPAKIDPR